MNKTHSNNRFRRRLRAKKNYRLDFQPLEARRLLAGIFFNPSNGIVTVDGTNSSDIVQVVQVTDSQFRVNFADMEVRDFANSDVSKIKFLGHDGDDWFGNETAISSLAFGQNGSDVLEGGAANDILIGGADDDRLVGRGGADQLYGGHGDDFAYGGNGDDILAGGEGDDFLAGHDGADKLYAGHGNDFVYGGNGDDILAGGPGDDNLAGHDGADKLYAGIGNDHAFGGNGDDVLAGDDGNDVMAGQAGNDLIFGGRGSDHIFGNDGVDRLVGGDDDDRIVGGSDGDLLFGQAGADNLRGQDGNDSVYGGNDDDLIRGGQGRDRLFGNAGEDDINGGDDNDILHGGKDNDILDGGAGDDDIYDDGDDEVHGDNDDKRAEADPLPYSRPIGLSNRLTVSFAPDGTSIFDQSSQLFSAFSSTVGTEEIKSTILVAFNEWAQHGNLDVGLVADSGDAFGTPGSTYGDSRFGDVRVGAMPMASDVFAIAMGQGDFVTGTWAGDILFNSNAQFDNADQFMAVALHEIGHVLGLAHTENLNSAMHRYSVRTDLAPIDIANFQDAYGLRSLDVHDDDEDETVNNDSPDNATEIKFEDDGVPEGTYPSISFGDISHSTDIDFFKLETPDGYTGSVTVGIVSEGISQLAPSVSLLSENGELVTRAQSNQLHGDMLSVTVDDVAGQKLFVKVDGGKLQTLGSFSMIVTLDEVNTIGMDTTLKVATGREFIQLDQEDIAEYFADPTSYLLNDDDHSDDDAGSATELKTEEGFEFGSRYLHQASLLDATDVDTYKFESKKFDSSTSSSMNISVRSIERGGMIPKVGVFDDAGNAVPSQVAVNGHGEYVVQVDNVVSSQEYFLSVAADDLLPFNSGNYELAISYSGNPIVFSTYAEGVLGSGNKKYHSMHVAESQVIQFAFESEQHPSNPNAMLWATIYDQSGAIVYQAATRSGERRTANTAFFTPGSYTIEIESAVGSSFSDLSYSLIGIDVGGPQGPVFSDPTDSPFDQNDDGEYEYPDDVVTLDNFVIVEGISSNQDDPPADDPPQDLFQWYWGFIV